MKIKQVYVVDNDRIFFGSKTAYYILLTHIKKNMHINIISLPDAANPASLET